jgi:hypothetical protein
VLFSESIVILVERENDARSCDQKVTTYCFFPPQNQNVNSIIAWTNTHTQFFFHTYETNKLRNYDLPQNANNNNRSIGKIDFEYFLLFRFAFAQFSTFTLALYIVCMNGKVGGALAARPSSLPLYKQSRVLFKNTSKRHHHDTLALYCAVGRRALGRVNEN